MGRVEDPRFEKWFEAAERGDIGDVLDFLESGYDVDAGDSTNTTALMRAVGGGHVQLIRVLLDQGASLIPQNSLGYTAMTCALLRSRKEYGKDPQPDRGPLELLLAAGARYELREAVMLNDVGLARTRLDEGADVDTGERTYHGPLLMIAAQLGYLAIVDLLLERGANIEATDDLGRRPLLGAASFGRIEVVRHLLDRGAEIDGDDWSNQTALSEAAAHGHQVIVDLLLSRGAKRGLLDAVAKDREPQFTDLTPVFLEMTRRASSWPTASFEEVIGVIVDALPDVHAEWNNDPWAEISLEEELFGYVRSDAPFAFIAGERAGEVIRRLQDQGFVVIPVDNLFEKRFTIDSAVMRGTFLEIICLDWFDPGAFSANDLWWYTTT